MRRNYPPGDATHNLGVEEPGRIEPLHVPIAAEGRCNIMELRNWLQLFSIQLRKEEGQTMTEYGILLALIAVLVIGALLVLGPAIVGVFNQVTANL
jgi:pilus assembly protein Flp/PilA